MTRHGARGISYLELLMVVAMIGVLTAVVLPTGLTVRRAAQARQLRRGLETIRAAIDRYHCDWIRGCIEPDDETGWPKDLEELRDGIDFAGDKPECQHPCGSLIEATPTGATPEEIASGELERKEVYLRHVPVDPFNSDGDEADTLGWAAIDYDDDVDSSSWGGGNVYDVRSSSDRTALDGTEYASW
jgi:general secretion pathway protein G